MALFGRALFQMQGWAEGTAGDRCVICWNQTIIIIIVIYLFIYRNTVGVKNPRADNWEK